MDTENRTHKIICHDCNGNGYRRDCYGEVYQCKECKSQGEITFTEEEMLENIDDVGLPVWKEKYLDIMVIGAPSKRNVYLKFCMRKKDDSNICKYNICRNYSHRCDVHYSLFNVLK